MGMNCIGAVLAAKSAWEAYDGVLDRVVASDIGHLTTGAGVLAATLAGISLIRISSDYIHGNGMTVWSIVRPLVILFLVLNFNIVGGGIRKVINVFTRDTATFVSKSDLQVMDKLVRKDAANAKQRQVDIWSDFEWTDYSDSDSDAGDGDGDGFSISKLGAHVMNWVKDGFINVMRNTWQLIVTFFRSAMAALWGSAEDLVVMAFTFLGMLLVNTIMFIQQSLAAIFLAMLLALGPFVFAFAILEPYKNGIHQWIARYIQISFWAPIGFMVKGMSNGLMMGFADANGGMSSIGSGLAVLVQYIAQAAMILAVPKIAGWVIESTGANDAHGKLSQGGTAVIRAIGRRII